MRISRPLRNGLTKDYLRRQEGRCAICGDPTPWKPSLDHDHRTHGFRGVLCGNCNTGLGFFCDSPELLQKAIAYLRIPRIARFVRILTRSETLVGKNNHQRGLIRSKESRLLMSNSQRKRFLKISERRRISRSVREALKERKRRQK